MGTSYATRANRRTSTSCTSARPKLSQAFISPRNLHLVRSLDGNLVLVGVFDHTRQLPAPLFRQAHNVHMMALHEPFRGIESEERASVIGRSTFFKQQSATQDQATMTSEKMVESGRPRRRGRPAIEWRRTHAWQRSTLFGRLDILARPNGAGQTDIALSEGHQGFDGWVVAVITN